jgi:hypothetical protein
MKNSITFVIIFGIIGTIFFTVSVFWLYNEYTFISRSIKTTGEVTKLIEGSSRGHSVLYPEITFKTLDDDEVQFKQQSAGNAHYQLHDAVPVIYDKNYPSNAQIDNAFLQWITPSVMLIFGIIFSYASIQLLYLDYLNPRRKAYLQQNGRRLDTQFVTTQVAIFTGSMRSKRPIGWRVKTLYQEGNKKYYFYSQMLKSDPQPIINKFHITSVPVWVDMKSMKKYYVAAEEILQLRKLKK